MKANEFVKENGWEKAKEALNRVAWCEGSYCTKLNHGCIKNNHECCVDVDDLKRLVESYELSDRLGGVETMLIMIEQMGINGLCDGMNISFDGEWQGVFTKHQLEQAISDVESCQ